MYKLDFKVFDYNKIIPFLTSINFTYYKLNFLKNLLLLISILSLSSCSKDLFDEKSLDFFDENFANKTRLSTYGDRAFCTAAPKLWNKLPLELKNSLLYNDFKSALKTFGL